MTAGANVRNTTLPAAALFLELSLVFGGYGAVRFLAALIFQPELSLLLACTAATAFMFLLSRKGGRHRISLEVPGIGSLCFWGATVTAYMVLDAGLCLWSGRDAVAPHTLRLFENSACPALSLFVYGVAVPWVEELFFRNLLQGGLNGLGLSRRWSILATAVIWAIPHVQYGWWDRGSILLLGLVLGGAREKTGALTVPFAIHSLVNVTTCSVAMFIS